MKEKRIFYSEIAYVCGILFVAFGTALITRADFGVSMVVAPAYILHLKLSQYAAIFTFGRVEYLFQAVLLIVMMLVLRRFRVSYLFSFVTAVVYGIVLDACIFLVGRLPMPGMGGRIIYYVFGLLFCAGGVSFMFHTYLSPEVYELFVKEVAACFHKDLSRTKTVYDCASCLLGILLSFVFFGFGKFVGVNVGTVICALVNGTLIGVWSKGLEKVFAFRDAFGWRRYFEKEGSGKHV